MRRLAYMIPILLGFWALDGWLSAGRTAGHERNTVLGSMTRWSHADRARVIVLGSSTTAELLRPNVIAKALRRSTADVIAGHVNGCHHGCTWAEVRAIAQRWAERESYLPEKKRATHRFDHVFLGANLFQQCEQAHSKRILQQVMMTPTPDLPRLLALYRHGEQPLRAIGRAFGMLLSGAYGDTLAVKHRLKLTRAFKAPRPAWFTAAPTAEDAPPRCDYTKDSTALKAAFTADLLADLTRLSKRVTLVLLPDRELAAQDPDQLAQLPAFRALMAELAAAHPTVELLDLIEGNPAKQKDFRDSIHFRHQAIEAQRAHFHARYEALRR